MAMGMAAAALDELRGSISATMLLIFTPVPVKNISPRSGLYFSNSAARCSVQVKCSFACRCLPSICARNFGRSKPELRLYASSASQSTEVQVWEEESLDYATGPLSGNLAEIEAFCRVQRIAEELHKAVMDRLRNLDREEQPAVSVGPSSSLDERVVAGLACIGATLQQGRMEILGGWAKDFDQASENVPRLGRFREKLRKCCKSLQVSLLSLIAVEGENLAIYSILQRLNNICLDAGFPRSSGAPGHGDIPNFGKVRLEQTSDELDFWKGGQLTEDGLKWLLENEFRTIVDLRYEEPENTLAEAALVETEHKGKIRRVKIPVKPETAPTMEQVREFASLVADVENRPIFLQSYAGIIRTSAMISRWREFVFRGGLECGDAVDGACAELWSDDSDAETPQTDIVASTRSGETAVAEGLRPFYAQLAGPDVFSRKAMSRFFRKRRISPSTILLNPKYKPNAKGSQEDRRLETEQKDDKQRMKNEPRSPSLNGAIVENGNGALAGPASNVDHAIVGGDMCSTKTGVVRLQSRKKAEMYLVRADGFSCTRERVMESTLAFTHPSTQQQMLMWKTPPKTVLLLKKLGDELMEEAMEVAAFLHNQEGMNVMVEPEVHDRFARYPGFGYIQTFYSHDLGSLHERVDFVVCLGGDGVILHVSNLFRNAVPPVVSFNLGSLGFLTAHPFEDFKHDLRALIHGNERIEGVYVTLRMRLRCEILRDGRPVPGKIFEVLNEVVVDRGSNPYLCKIECYERNRLITKVQADGVLVATPTGSTAYNTAAGGSMVHPNVPCMLFTPICPHSLSFRPVILPDSAILELKVPNNSRNSAWVSFDGKRRQQLLKGDSVRIYMSSSPIPTVNKSDQTWDWFRSLNRCFNWSDRKEQKALRFS